MQIPYFKRGLRIDLSSNSISFKKIDDCFYRTYLGGKGLGIVLLLNNLSPSTDPLSEGNKLIFLTGPLTASGFPCASRGVMVTKSPLTGTFLDSNIGGRFGRALKSTGFDFIMIEGKSPTPVWIDIYGDNIQINDATKLWGLTTNETSEQLMPQARNKRRAEVLTIGPAGERQVMFASISCGGRMFGRGGSGAVMGAKNLKAILLGGKEDMPWFNSKLFRDEIKKARGKLLSNPLTKKNGAFQKCGTTFTIEATQGAGVLPTRNWQESVFENADRLCAETFYERKIKSTTCFQCPIGCSRVVETRGDNTIRNEGPEYETIFAFGANCGIDNPDVIIEADFLCEQYGLDTITCGSVIAFFMECSSKGLLSSIIGQAKIRFGDEERLLELIKRIGQRKGIGDLLATGVKRISEQLGPEAKRIAMCVKGLELPGYDPRGMKGMALLYATSDRGGCHLRGSTLRAELMGLPTPVDRFSYEGKPKMVVELQRAYTVMNVISECLFAGFALTMEDYAAALSALFEESITPNDLVSVGKRIWDLTRIFNYRAGFNPGDDTLPQRLFDDPVPSGPSKGHVIDRNAFQKMKQEYYAHQGWDEKTGIPFSYNEDYHFT